MRILNSVKQEQKRRFALLFRDFQNIFHLSVLISSGIRHHALMVSRLGHGIQTFLRNKIYDRVMLFRFSHDRAHRSVLTSVKDKQTVDGLSGAERLQNSIAPFNRQFFISHRSSPLFVFPYRRSQLFRSLSSPEPQDPPCVPFFRTGKDIPSEPQSLSPSGNPSSWHSWP